MADRVTPAVLHIAAPARHGGLERVLIELGKAQVARGKRVAVALVLVPGDESDHPLAAALERAGIETHSLVVPASDYRNERRLVADLLARLEPDVLHTHGYRPDVMDSGLAHRGGAISVSTAHGFIGTGVRSWIYHRLQIRAARRMDALVAVSDAIADRFRAGGVRPERLHVVPNAIGTIDSLPRAEARARLGLPEQATVVGWLGRLSREKGGDIFLEALEHSPRDLLGVVIGDGPERDALRLRAQASGLAGRVTFTGALPEASTLLSAFDVFALTSRTEGTPMALLEAMSVGLPVVATAVGGVPSVLGEDAGILVEPEQPLQVAGALSRLMGATEDRERLGAMAQERAISGYGVTRWADAYDGIYGQCLERRRRVSR